MRISLASLLLAVAACSGETIEERWAFGQVKEEREVRDGLLHGESIRYFLAGGVRERTEYSRGKKHGRHVLYAANGVVLEEGEYFEDLRHGHWVTRRQGGTVFMEGELDRGTGRVTVFGSDGAVLGAQDFVRDRPADGPWRAWHENGRIKAKGAWRDALRTGEWTYWFPDGDLASEGEYREGKKHGPWTFWSGVETGTGTKWAEGQYLDGKPEGVWIFHTTDRADDKGRHTGSYVGGVGQGIWRVLDLDGNVVKEILIRDGVRAPEK